MCAFFTLSARTVSRPPSGIAWIALVKRLAKTRFIWLRSTATTTEGSISPRSMRTEVERLR